MAGGHKYSKVPVKRAKSTTRQIVLKHAPTLLLIILGLSDLLVFQGAVSTSPWGVEK